MSVEQFALSSDLINELLQGMRLRGVEYRRINAGPRFGLGFAAKPGHAWFHFVTAGNAMLHMEDGTTYELSAGNAVFISHGAAHELLSHPGEPVQDIDRLNGAALGDTVSAVDIGTDASPMPSTLLFSGCMEFELGSIHGLGQLMPGLMLIDAGGQRYPGLVPILSTMEREVSAARVGFAGILARLADVVAAMIVSRLGGVRLRERFWPRRRLARSTPGWRTACAASTTGPRLDGCATGRALPYLTFSVRRPLSSDDRHVPAALCHRTANAARDPVADTGTAADRRSGAASGLYLTGRFQPCIQAHHGQDTGFEPQGEAACRSLESIPLTHLPPVTSRNVPVTNDASSLASHRIARATSSG